MPQTFSVKGELKLRLNGDFTVAFADNGVLTIAPAATAASHETQTRPNGAAPKRRPGLPKGKKRKEAPAKPEEPFSSEDHSAQV